MTMKSHVTLIMLFLFTLLMGISTPLHAEKVNIFNDNKNSVVIVNGKQYNTNSVYNLELPAGTHHVKVLDNEEVLFSDIIEVKSGIVTTVNTNSSTSTTALRATKEEIKQFKKTRGTLGIGLHFSTVGGFSIKKNFNKFGIQLVGLTGTDTNNYYYDTISTNETDYMYSLRLSWILKEKYLKNNQPLTLFWGLGYGKSTYEAFSSVYAYISDVETDFYETFITIERSTFLGAWSFGLSYVILQETGNYLASFYGTDGIPYSYDVNGIRLNLGYHFYF